MVDLSGKVALVTGAARGMGAEIARRMVKAGAKVVLGDVLDEDGRQVAAEIGDGALYVHLDVRDDADWKAAVSAAVDQFGKLDILVNNAGIVHFGATEDIERADAERVLAVNVLGPILGAKHAVSALRHDRNGVIINMSSIDGLWAGNGRIAYTASKWAVRGLTKSLTYEYGPEGIRAVSIHPGIINTALGNPLRLDQSELADSNRRYPLQRMGEPGDVADVVVFVASDAAAFVSGAEIAVDGGWSAGQPEPALPGGAAYVKPQR